MIVKGLPRGFTSNGSTITGAGQIVGRWPVEVTALHPDGRSSTTKFSITIANGSPTGATSSSPAVDIDLLSDTPTPLPFGVVGNDRAIREAYISGGNPNDTTPSLDVTVWDMIEVNGHMYVGGEFAQVISEAGQRTNQAFLARFDIVTGDWDSSWRPQLDGNVHALEVSPRGRLLVGGEFTNVDGVPGTEGLAAINVRTGEVDPTFEASVERPWNPDAPAVVRDIVVADKWLYIVGKFSHVNGAGGARERAYSAARVTANFGTIDSTWKPQVAGQSIWEVAPNHQNNRVYLVGFFSAVNGEPNTVGGGTVDALTGASVGNNYFPHNATCARCTASRPSATSCGAPVRSTSSPPGG